MAKHQQGYWFKQGMRVKSALIQEIGGRYVSVAVHGYDKYDRVVGTVTCDGRDIGEWLVWNGYAIAAYGEQYKHLERNARSAACGAMTRHTIQDTGVTGSRTPLDHARAYLP